MINNNDYFMIQGFMLNQLKLKSTELNVYAIIFSYTKNGSETKFTRNYLSEFCGTSKKTIERCLISLAEKKYIFKRTETYKDNILNYYRVNLDILETNCLQGIDKKSTAIDKKSTNNNKDNFNKNNTSTNNYATTKKSINLKQYLLNSFSTVAQDLIEMYIDGNNIYLKISGNELFDFVKRRSEIINRQCNFYNMQYQTEYTVNLIKTKAV